MGIHLELTLDVFDLFFAYCSGLIEKRIIVVRSVVAVSALDVESDSDMDLDMDVASF